MPFPHRLRPSACARADSPAHARGLPVLLLALTPSLVSPLLADPAPEESLTNRLAVHGYLTQAYATADDHPLLGIPTDGTTDYRTAALQLRYAVTDKDNFVIQLSHERFGESPFAGKKDDVEVDWVFYERRFSDRTSLRVGKVQIPLGIYNEIRDVGTLLPLYHPPFNFYGEGAVTSETVDGFVLSHAFDLGGAWSLDGDVYYGGWDIIEVEPATNRVSEGRASNQVGVQLWAATPLPGLRLGGGITRFDLRDQLLSGGRGERELHEWNLGVDGSFERWLARAEYLFVDFPPGDYRAWYVQLGARLDEHLQLLAQGDFSRLRFSLAPLPVRFDGSFQEDLALAASWSFRSNLVAKLEAHRAEGYRFDEPINLFTQPPFLTRYYVLSLSTSF
jgi:hypothetical protein